MNTEPSPDFPPLEALAPEQHAYPAPRLSMMPLLTPTSLGRADTPPSRFLRADAQFVRSGRVALAQVLQALALPPGERVLMPAYHCPSMLTPLRERGLRCEFYPLNERLEPPLPELQARLQSGVRACVLPHYFGFAQTETAAIAARCRSAGVALIEDCAHAFFGGRPAEPVGSHGDFAIASSRKFFPGNDGGFAVSNGAERLPPVMPGPWKAELKNIYDTLQRATRGGYWPWLTPLFGTAAPASAVSPARFEAMSVWQSNGFSAAELTQRGSRVCALLIRACDKAALAARRRRHYRAWAAALQGLDGVQAFAPELAEEVVPYVFPVLVAEPDRAFHTLKAQGFPMYRWEYLAHSTCAVSRRYATTLWQLPCAQQLTDADLSRLIQHFRAAF